MSRWLHDIDTIGPGLPINSWFFENNIRFFFILVCTQQSFEYIDPESYRLLDTIDNIDRGNSCRTLCIEYETPYNYLLNIGTIMESKHL